MRHERPLWLNPAEHLATETPSRPLLYVSPAALQATARRFLDGFPGLVTYAVKANDAPVVLDNLAAAGVRAFDVASPAEIALVASLVPGAVMHYNNPVRGTDEILAARAAGVKSYSVDSFGELEKLIRHLDPCEISVRLRLPVKGAAYDFGSKFGATPDVAAQLLRRVVEAGFTPSITFHPGTQCTDPQAWVTYIATSAQVARDAGVELVRLNVGGGFPSHRLGDNAPSLEEIFEAIRSATAEAFGPQGPALVCEPGRAMVAEAYTLATRVRAIRDDGAVFLNDGIYGGLAEIPLIGPVERITVLSETASRRLGARSGRVVFGPTCDSLDRLPGLTQLPDDIQEGDWLLFEGLGAYSTATATRFNGYGDHLTVTVQSPRP